MNLAMRKGIKVERRLYADGSKKVINLRRKVMRIGGSVVVALPKKIRQDVGMGVGDYVMVSEGPEGTIIIKKEGKVWDGRIARKD